MSNKETKCVTKLQNSWSFYPVLPRKLFCSLASIKAYVGCKLVHLALFSKFNSSMSKLYLAPLNYIWWHFSIKGILWLNFSTLPNQGKVSAINWYNACLKLVWLIESKCMFQIIYLCYSFCVVFFGKHI